MKGMNSKNVAIGKIIVVFPNKKSALVDVKEPKIIKPLQVSPQMAFIKPSQNSNEIQKSIICFA